MVPSEDWEESVSSLSPWLVDVSLLPVSSLHLSSEPVSGSKFPLYKETNHVGLGPTLTTLL